MSSRHLLFFLSVFSSLQSMDDLEPRSRSGSNVMKPLTWVGSGIMWPFKKIGSALAQGAQEQIMQNLQVSAPAARGRVLSLNGRHPLHGRRRRANSFSLGIPARNQPGLLEQNMGLAVNAFFVEMSKATDPRGNNAAGAQLIRNVFNSAAITVADLYNPEGEGRRALENLFRSFKEFMNHDGVIQATVRQARHLVFNEFIELLKDIERINRLQGDAHNAVRALADNVAHGVDRVGQSVDSSSRKIVRNVLIGSVLVISSWFIWRHVERNLIKPRLALETSRKNFFTKMWGYFFGAPEKELPTMIFSQELQDRLTGIATAACIIKEKINDGHTNIKYRNLLLWGPPGTGKTMFARLLAQYSGMDYVIMSGASFAQYHDGEGITQMNKLFEWANTSTNGLIIFIDEAEAFLSKRVDQDVTKESYQLLTNFLNLTGERSDKVMLVFATNRPKELDDALKRRIDDAVQMKLPQEEQRLAILKLYRDMYLIKADQLTDAFKKSVNTTFNDEVLLNIAHQTEGLSGGELEGIVNALVSDASITKDGLITHELVDTVVAYTLDKHKSFMQGFEAAVAVG